MSKDNDDLINELNDFENGLRDVEKSKPQPSNHDSDGSGNNDLLDGLNNLGHVNRSENENRGSNKQNTDEKPLDELNDLANDVNKRDSALGKDSDGKFLKNAGIKDPKKADAGLNDLSNALGSKGNPVNHADKIADGIKNLNQSGALDSLNGMSGGVFGGGLNALKEANKNPVNDDGQETQRHNQRGIQMNFNPRNNRKSPWQRAKDFGHRAWQGLKNGAKDVVGRTATGITAGVKGLTGHTLASATAMKVAVTSLSLPLVAGGGIGVAAYTSYNHYQILDASKVCAVANDNGSGFADSADGSENKDAEKLAKQIFDSWVHLGCSGAAAAGIVGHISGEGGITIPDKAEGCFANSKECEIAYGAQPDKSDAGGGGGVYQLTPYSAFAPVGDKKWLDLDAQTKFFYDNKIGNKDHFRWFAHLTDPIEATVHWNDFESGTDTNLEAREATAKKYYEKFNGASISANDSLLGKGASEMADINSSIAEAVNNAVCSNSGHSAGQADGNMLSTAKKLLNYFSYAEVRPVPQHVLKDHGSEIKPGDLDAIDKNGQTDCTGFVYVVAALCGKKVPPSGWYVGSMVKDAEGPQKYLKKIDESDAQPGDIILVITGDGSGPGSHAAILETKFYGKNDKTRIINEGGRTDRDSVNEDGFQSAFYSLLASGRIVICRPVS